MANRTSRAFRHLLTAPTRRIVVFLGRIARGATLQRNGVAAPHSSEGRVAGMPRTASWLTAAYHARLTRPSTR